MGSHANAAKKEGMLICCPLLLTFQTIMLLMAVRLMVLSGALDQLQTEQVSSLTYFIHLDDLFCSQSFQVCEDL